MQGINEEGEPIEHRMVTSSIERAQKKVEGRNFDMRKQLLEYDDVANDQRQMIYRQRNELMEADDVSETVNALWHDVINEVIDGFIPPQSLEEQWDIAGLEQALHTEFGLDLPVRRWLESQDDLFEDPLRDQIEAEILTRYEQKEALVGPDIRLFEKRIMLDILDNLWKEHLAAMDYLRQGIHLRAYAQKQPKQEYKREAFELFEELLNNVKIEVVRFLSRVEFRSDENVQALEEKRRAQQANSHLNFEKANSESLVTGESAEASEQTKAPFVRGERKVGRNEPCPCGSGRKYKTCHGKLS